MNPTGPGERKEKAIPVAGVILSCLVTIDVIYISFSGIVPMCGELIYMFYRVSHTLLVFLHLFPGLILIPALLIVFIIQAIRSRKNRRYIRNCGFSVLWCFLIVLIGGLIGNISPAIEKTIIDVKIQAYESTVDEVHSGAQIQKLADMTGGTKGSEDVAFFQYSPGEYEEAGHRYYMTEYYILYSEDSSCDVERIKEHARGHRLYMYGEIEMQEIKENWYWLKVTYELFS